MSPRLFSSTRRSASRRRQRSTRTSRPLRLERLEGRVVLTGALTFADAILDNTGGTEGIMGPTSTIVSPDGRNVYSVGTEDALSVFHRDPASGELTFIEVHRDDVNGVDGLAAPDDVTISPDGQNVYVAASLDDAISVFSRDPSTGRLTFVQMLKDGVGGVDGLDAPGSVVVSPDGKSVYATGALDAAVAVFSRNTDTGVLNQVEVQFHGGGPNDPKLQGVADVAVSTDGQSVYAVSILNSAINVFNRNQSTGALTLVDVLIDQDEPGGDLGVDGMRGAREVTVSGDDSNVYVLGDGDDALAVFSRGAGGGLSFLEFHQDGVDGVRGLIEGWSLLVSGDGQHLYAASRHDSSIALFDRDTTGRLTFVELVQDGVNGVDGLTAVTNVSISPDDNHLYAAAHLDHSITLFDRNASSGELDFVRLHQNGNDMIDGLDGAVAVAVSPDGRSVYTTSGNPDHSLSVFLRDPGGLTFMQVLKDGVNGADGLQGASDVTVSPDGDHVYVTSEAEDALSVYHRDATTGVLTFSQMLQEGGGDVMGLDAARGVKVSPDGKHVYVTAGASLSVFSRAAGTGQLTFVEVQTDGLNGVTGLFGARDLVVSNDGNNVYAVAAGSIFSGLTTFHRDETTGALTFDGVLRDGVNGVDGLASPEGVDISADGKSVYVSSPVDNSVALFDRDQASGGLSFVELLRDGVNGVDGLDGAQDVAVSPDGKNVFVTAGALFIDDEGLAVFSRDQATGALTFVEVFKDGVGPTNHLLLSRGVAVSPDGENVFVVSAADDALNIFNRDVTAPETFIDSVPPAITNSTNATFDFSSDESPVTYECNLDGAGFNACTDPSTFNSLAEGEHTLEVRAIDQAGNVDPSPASHTWTIDVTAPDTFVDAAPPAVTDSTSATFDFSSNEASVTYECNLDGAGFNACTDPVTFDGLAEGEHTLEVRAIDQAANADATPASHTWTIEINTAGIVLQDGVLRVVGTDNRDSVHISQRNGSLDVFARLGSDRVRRSFPVGQVDKIEMHLLDGNDTAIVSGRVSTPVLIDGGAGRDLLLGGNGPNVLLGGDGNDILLGGINRDILIGGRGRDLLLGRGGDDLLVAGSTEHDNNVAALDLALSEWTSDRDYETRVANLMGIGAGPRNNDTIFFNAQTVHDDGARDILFGSSGRDWFLANREGDGAIDLLRWLRPGEEITDTDPLVEALVQPR